MKVEINKVEREVRYIFTEAEKEEISKFYNSLGYSGEDILYDLQRYNTLYRVMQLVFRKHQVFYDYIGFEYGKEHHPNNSVFSGDDYGFSEYLYAQYNVSYIKDLTYEDWKELVDITTSFLKNIVADKATMLSYFVDKVDVLTSVSSVSSKSDVKLEDIEFDDEALIVSSNGVFSLKISKLNNINTLKDLEKEIAKTIREFYEKQLQAKIKAKEKEIKLLKKKIEEMRLSKFKEAINLLKEITAAGWSIEDDKLIFKKKITVNSIKYKDTIFEINDDTYYVHDLIIKFRDITDDMKVKKVLTSKAVHANVNDNNELCLGDYELQDLFKVLRELPKAIKTMNLDSAFDHSFVSELKEKYAKIDKEKEVWIA